MFERLLELRHIVYPPQTSMAELLNEGLPESYEYGVGICFSENGDYVGIKLKTGSSDVVYMSGPPKGCDPTAVSKFPGSSKKVVERLERSLNNLCKSPKTEKLHPTIYSIIKNYDKNRIIKELDEELSTLDTKNKYPYIFIALFSHDEITPLYTKKCVHDYMVENAMEKYGIPNQGKKNCNLTSHGRSCSICGNNELLVYGNFSRIACYNLDKKGMISGGFGYEQALSNFPVCKECIAGVSAGFSFAEKNLTFPLCGERYILLPSVKDEKMRDIVLDVINGKERNSLKKSALERITYTEREILEELAEVTGGKDTVSFSLCFFEKENASWRITSEIHEVLPSRITKIYDAKKKIEADPFMVLSKKESESGYHFTLGTVKEFTGTKGHGSKKKFMSYIEAVFSTGYIQEKVLLKDLVYTIVSAYKSDFKTAPYTVRNALAVYNFFDVLNIIQKEGESVEISNNGKYCKFLDSAFFDKKEKVVAFLSGCYVDSVLYVQYKKLESKPFIKKLKGLKLNSKDLKVIYSEARNKLLQYDKFGIVSELDPLLAQSWIDCGSEWTISDDETTFAFTLGLSLGGKIARSSADE